MEYDGRMMRRALLIAIALASAPACNERVNPGAPTGMLQVTAVDVRILESFPPQVHITARGVQPDPCTTVESVTQRRDGNVITVTIITRPGATFCIQVLTPVDQNVALQGTFGSGTYVVRVNGLEREFSI
jgi:inhibitor of cysteine peptidase